MGYRARESRRCVGTAARTSSEKDPIGSSAPTSILGPFFSSRSTDFHHFLKLALTKSPKKRPVAEKLLQVCLGEMGTGKAAAQWRELQAPQARGGILPSEIVGKRDSLPK